MIANHEENGFVDVLEGESELIMVDAMYAQVVDVDEGREDKEVDLQGWMVVECEGQCNED